MCGQETRVSLSKVGSFRFGDPSPVEHSYRSEYRRDFARILHSPSFRRLEHKTQLFPGHESDFFRNRLTHSLEVAQIAKTIALKLREEYPDIPIEPEVCEIAGLLHDIGHPPFGHNGEKALDECMANFGGFEGNAQTLRIITKLEKKEFDDGDECLGLNLTYRSIASILKYDEAIPFERKDGDPLQKGYYQNEQSIIDCTKKAMNLDPQNKMKTVECSIMDLADDIAYSTYDIEDAFKAGFLNPLEMMSADFKLFGAISEKLKHDDLDVGAEECLHYLIQLFNDIGVWDVYKSDLEEFNSEDEHAFENFLFTTIGIHSFSKKIAKDGFLRTKLTSSLVNSFVNGVNLIPNQGTPLLSQVCFDEETATKVGILKYFTHEYLISSSRLKVVENRGYKIVKEIFNTLDTENGYEFLPDDFKKLFIDSKDIPEQKRVLCDFIAGMTDRYASEYHGRLFSESPQTIFKPM